MIVTLDPPRWKGGPEICPVANLPAFNFPKQLDDFLKDNAPSAKVVKKWQCDHCKCWHAYTLAPDVSGGSSGTGRSTNLKTMQEWKRFFNATSAAEMLDDYE